MGQRLGAEDPAFVAAKRCHNRPHRVTGALQTCFTDMFQLWTFMFQMIFFFHKYKAYNHESARHSVFDGEFTNI